MKALMLVGVVVLVLGIVSFFVPFPHSEHHGVNIGDAHVGITTHDDEKVSPSRELSFGRRRSRADDRREEELGLTRQLSCEW